MHHLFKNKNNVNSLIKQLYMRQQQQRKLQLSLFKQQKRQATHHAPEWNEPSGNLFGEKVSK